MKTAHTLVLAILLAMLCWGCRKDGVIFDEPFVYITSDVEGDYSETSSVPSALNNQIKIYNVHLCSPVPQNTISVQFEVVPGDGLKEGIDYKVETSGGRVRFAPGVFNKIIQIRYLKNPVDESRDNSLTIRLTGSDSPVTLGFPGPAHKNIQHIITKFN